MVVLALVAAASAGSGAFVEGGPSQLVEAGVGGGYEGDEPGYTVLGGYERLADHDGFLSGWRVGLGVAEVNADGGVASLGLLPAGLAEVLGGYDNRGWYALGGLGAEVLLFLPQPGVSLQAGARWRQGTATVTVGPYGRFSLMPVAFQGQFPAWWKWTGGVTLSIGWP